MAALRPPKQNGRMASWQPLSASFVFFFVGTQVAFLSSRSLHWHCPGRVLSGRTERAASRSFSTVDDNPREVRGGSLGERSQRPKGDWKSTTKQRQRFSGTRELESKDWDRKRLTSINDDINFSPERRSRQVIDDEDNDGDWGLGSWQQNDRSSSRGSFSGRRAKQEEVSASDGRRKRANFEQRQGTQLSRHGQPKDTSQKQARTPEEQVNVLKKLAREPVTFTTIIKRAVTVPELAKSLSVAMKVTSLNTIHTSAAFSKLASFKKQVDMEDSIGVLKDLARHASRLAKRNDFSARELANVLMSVASLRKVMPWLSEVVAPSLLQQVPDLVSTMTPQALSNIIWAVGVLDLGDSSEADRAIEAAAAASLAQLGRFSNIDIAQVAWGLGSRGIRGISVAEDLLNSIGAFVVDVAPSMEEKSALTDLPMIACSFVKLGIWNAQVMDTIATRLAQKDMLKELRLWGLAVLFWSWSQPCSPVASPEHEGQTSTCLAATFLKKLRKEVDWRRLSQEDIDQSPAGPKAQSCSAWQNSRSS